MLSNITRPSHESNKKQGSANMAYISSPKRAKYERYLNQDGATRQPWLRCAAEYVGRSLKIRGPEGQQETSAKSNLDDVSCGYGR